MPSKKLQRLGDSPVGTRFNAFFDNRDVEGLRSVLFGDPTRRVTRLTRGTGGRPSPDDMRSLIHLKDETTANLDTPFELACFEGDVALLSLFLEYLNEVGRPESVDTPNPVGCTGLYFAAMQGYEQCVALLLASGANVDVVSTDGGSTPI